MQKNIKLINLEILNNDIVTNFPIIVEKDDIIHKYLKERTERKYKKIHKEPQEGIINGMWANSIGKGGILPIECKWCPSTKDFDLKLTGMQGDVMKESMNVAKTLAWNLTSHKNKTKWKTHFKKSMMKGIHIHCPEGATPKDGPSAGTAITVTFYSIFNEKKIKNTIAITGEMNLQGQVTAIGGLELKIQGARRAGIKEIIFPKENEDDFKKYCKKYDKGDTVFHPVENIKEVLELVFIS